MTGKRYFKRMWEEEYYIFDSEIISENEFDEKVEYEDYQAFSSSMTGDEVVEFLNKLHKENERLKKRVKELELSNDGLNYALQNIRKIDVEIDTGGKE